MSRFLLNNILLTIIILTAGCSKPTETVSNTQVNTKTSNIVNSEAAVVKVNLDQFIDGDKLCQIHFSFENKSNINFTSLWISVSVYDKQNYIAQSQEVQDIRLPPLSKARGYYTYANINCNEIGNIKINKLSGTAETLTKINNSSIDPSTAQSLKFEGFSNINGVRLLDSN